MRYQAWINSWRRNKGAVRLVHAGALICGLAWGVAQAKERHALLVGCSKYPNAVNIACELKGAPQNVAIFSKLLKDKFNFSDDNIQILADWPEDAAKRPTAANIALAYDKLIQKVGKGDEVVLLMDGHGTQLPIPAAQTDALDPANPEPDGMDEVFLPADIEPSGTDDIANSLRDNRFAEWLQKLRNRGASVWIVFDCCHSNTLTRAVRQVGRPKGLRPDELSVPEAAIREAERKAREARERRPQDAAVNAPRLNVPADAGEGKVVAFFAAQAFERAWELPRPRGAEDIDENQYGLFTYTLTKILRQSQGPLSYRDLARRIVSEYRSELTYGPTPAFEGDLDKEVLGETHWAAEPIYLERSNGQARVSAGQLSGIQPGAILAVHAPRAAGAKTEPPIAYVKVDSASLATADVTSVAHNNLPAVDLGTLPDNARCAIVMQDVGDLRVRVAVAAAGKGADAELHAQLRAAFEQLPDKIKPLVEVTDNEASAQWVLQVTKPDDARALFRLDLQKPSVLLVSGNGCQHQELSQARGRQLFAQYHASNAPELATALSRDLRKIFTWQNVWRVASTVEAAAADDVGLKMTVNVLPGKASMQGASHVVHPGDSVRLKLKNDGNDKLALTLLYLGDKYEITHSYRETLDSGQATKEMRYSISRAGGPQGFVVLATRFVGAINAPDFSFLEQSPLGEIEAAGDAPARAPQSAFGRLMTAVRGLTDVVERGPSMDDPLTPRIVSWSWISVPIESASP
jgi:hypothetical protein